MQSAFQAVMSQCFHFKRLELPPFCTYCVLHAVTGPAKDNDAHYGNTL